MLVDYDTCEQKFACRISSAFCKVSNSSSIKPFSCNECCYFMLCEYCIYNRVCSPSPDFYISDLAGDDCG